MGLFGKKRQKKEQQAQQPTQMPIIVSPWKVPPATRTYRLPAEHEANIYTYNGMPFRGLRQNTRFVVTAVPADVQMTSIYTGLTASTGNYGDIAYEYNGQIFGFCSSHAEAVRNMMMAGYRVEVEAYIRKYDGEKGFPYVVGLFGFVDDAVYMDARMGR